MNEPRRKAAPALAGEAGGESVAPDHSALLIDAQAAAAALGIGGRTLWGLTKCNAIPSRRIGRAVRYSPSELRAWIAADCPTDAGAAERVRRAMRKGVTR